MLAEIIVAVICNFIALLVLVSGIFTARSNGFKVTIIKFFGTIGALAGGYFLTPVISGKIYGIEGFRAFIENNVGASVGTINSCIFLLLFMVIFAITFIICNIVKHCLIKKMQDKKLNKIKIKRAKSINPKAEKMVRKSEWKAAKAKYADGRKWYHKLLSGFFGVIIAAIVGIVILMPFGFIGKDINKISDKSYLTNGFEHTLNGVIPESVFDWILHNEAKVSEECVHEYVEGVCSKCGEAEVPAELPCEHIYEEGVCTQCGEAEVIE